MAIPNLQPGTSYAIHLRAPSSTGGKDWVGSLVNGNEIHTFWGKTGQINQHSDKRGDLEHLQKSQQPQAANPGPTKPPPKLKPVPILKQSHEESSDIKPIEWDF